MYHVPSIEQEKNSVNSDLQPASNLLLESFSAIEAVLLTYLKRILFLSLQTENCWDFTEKSLFHQPVGDHMTGIITLLRGPDGNGDNQVFYGSAIEFLREELQNLYRKVFG